ncbi:sensor histidine kinase [Phyllobacterium chamaecytisi]|uniref:sensor histidine kinase n=1 Tax=Phyllobacterium chamaecytisi TaxID=2876082 RepID=UPI001CD0345D|nr:HAMP domain-containing sensor histidine kinase [Phyllobacterium sp. KW56]MBZ9601103.1 HAMP domain-containing histidine kinase [Phyllobacterium sp. KW56]
MKRWWKRSLAAQFIGLMLLALALSQALSFFVSWDERGKALQAAAKAEFFSRTASLATLLETIPTGFRNDVLDATGTAYSRFWLSSQAPADADAWRREAWVQLSKPMPNLKALKFKMPGAATSTAAETARPEPSPFQALAAQSDSWTTLGSHVWTIPQPAKFLYLGHSNGMGLAVELSDGTWLNTAYAKSVPNSIWNVQSLSSLGITAAILSLIGVIVARQIASPMRRLAMAAEALGRGESVQPLPEAGPDDIRQTAEAFNRMQCRLHRFVEDRTRMLAAIGHDLRTPLTSLRLRAEFVTEPDVQQRMLATIDEIQTMTEAALAFAREEGTVENTRAMNISALVESICDDMAELGQDVKFLEGEKIVYRCRPDALRRAFRNLIENAVRYGERARVSVGKRHEGIDIIVEDDGPGIPETAFEDVFAPFFRLEQSRNRETGGVGLGLSIARAIIHHHGGEIALHNSGSGLRVVVALPAAQRIS